MTTVPGTLYLLHFSSPLGDPGRPRMSARHYLGWAADLDTRLAEHRNGAGARITAAAVRAGIELTCTWTAPGTKNDERRLKRNGHHERRCPACN